MQNSCVRETSGLHESNVPYRLFVVPILIPLSSHFLCRLSSLGTSSSFTSFASSLFISPLCTPPDTCPIFSLCVFRVPIPLPLCRPFCPSFLRPWAFRSPCACFQPRCPTFPVLFPLFPAAFPSSSSFVPAFSFPFSPLFSSPSFSIKKKVPS